MNGICFDILWQQLLEMFTSRASYYSFVVAATQQLSSAIAMKYVIV